MECMHVHQGTEILCIFINYITIRVIVQLEIGWALQYHLIEQRLVEKNDDTIYQEL